MESTISETHGERESSEQTKQPRTSRKRKRGDRTASSSLSSADHTRKSRKVAIEYSTDETDEEKIPDMEEGMAFPQQMKTVKLTLPATPSQVHLARSFVEWIAYHGMRPGIRAALVSRKWTDTMIANLSITSDRSMASTAKQPCSRTTTKVTQMRNQLNSKGDAGW